LNILLARNENNRAKEDLQTKDTTIEFVQKGKVDSTCNWSVALWWQIEFKAPVLHKKSDQKARLCCQLSNSSSFAAFYLNRGEHHLPNKRSIVRKILHTLFTLGAQFSSNRFN
jgi:hypothetical protein